MKSNSAPSLPSLPGKDWILIPTLSAGLTVRSRKSASPLFHRSVTLSLSLSLCRALLCLGALLLGMKLFLWGMKTRWVRKGRKKERKKWRKLRGRQRKK